jgi:hypothetical protein
LLLLWLLTVGTEQGFVIAAAFAAEGTEQGAVIAAAVATDGRY